ncbi:MAG: hypothetical protein E5W44_03215 [Mesorhizobium sp.]|nr:MAG: hypothetical protein E5W44_03215 [Mesorhizobium sp.]
MRVRRAWCAATASRAATQAFRKKGRFRAWISGGLSQGIRGRISPRVQNPESNNPIAIDPSGENALAFSSRAAAPRQKNEKLFSGRSAGQNWHRRKTHVDAANAIIEEINDRSRIAAGGESAGRDVQLLPAIRAR